MLTFWEKDIPSSAAYALSYCSSGCSAAGVGQMVPAPNPPSSVSSAVENASVKLQR